MSIDNPTQGTEGWAIFRTGPSATSNPPRTIYATREEAEEEKRRRPGNGTDLRVRRAVWKEERGRGCAEPLPGGQDIPLHP